MNMLILGGAGFLGTNLTLRCAQESDMTVTVCDSLDAHFHSNTDGLRLVWDRIRFVQGDMRDEALLAGLVDGQDIIINCAAQTSHPKSITHPLLDVDINCLGNIKLLEAVRLHNKEAIVVYISSSTVIGRAVERIVDEDHGEKPLEIYSANKSVAEKYYEIYHSMHDIKTVIIRFANLYGPFGKGYPEFGFVNYFIDQAWQGKEITIFGPGTQGRNVMYVHDAVESLLTACQCPRVYGKPYFATSDVNLSVAEIARTITEVLGRGSVGHVDWPPERSRMEIGNVKFSSARFRDLTGWQPQYDFVQGLEEVKKHYEQLPESR